MSSPILPIHPTCRRSTNSHLSISSHFDSASTSYNTHTGLELSASSHTDVEPSVSVKHTKQHVEPWANGHGQHDV